MKKGRYLGGSVLVIVFFAQGEKGVMQSDQAPANAAASATTVA